MLPCSLVCALSLKYVTKVKSVCVSIKQYIVFQNTWCGHPRLCIALQSGSRCLPGRGQRKEAWCWASVGGMGGDPRTWEGVISAKSRAA